MKRKSKISLLFLPIIGLLICASTSRAQVTATARVTLTVVPAPGLNFTPANPAKNSAAMSQADNGGITLHTSSNVAVMLKTSGEKNALENNNPGQGVTKTLTPKELSGVSKVEVVYLGS